MTYLRRTAIFCTWTALAFGLWFFLNLNFVFGDCVVDVANCMAKQNMLAQIILASVSGLYGLGLGMLFQRWFFQRDFVV